MKALIPIKQNISNDKTQFIIGMLGYAVKKNPGDLVGGQLLKLVESEIGKVDEQTTNKGLFEKLKNAGAKIYTTIKEDKQIKEPEGIYEQGIEKEDEVIEEPKKSKLPFPRPKETKNFLSLFNNSEGLKYLTHRFKDNKPDYDAFMQLCKNEYAKARKDYPNTASKLLGRIEAFAFSPTPKWYKRKGKELVWFENGWSKPEFIEWYKNSPNHPASNTKWNQEMIIPFKETIEIRAGNLLNIIQEQIDEAFGVDKDSFMFNINEKELNAAEFYTDVDMFQKALFHIFSMIKEKAETNFKFKININFINETLDGGTFKKLIITHVNSEPTKYSNDPNFAKGDLKTLQTNLWGLCNYEVAGKFPDGYAKRVILTDDSKIYWNNVTLNKSIPLEENLINGFTHILKFY